MLGFNIRRGLRERLAIGLRFHPSAVPLAPKGVRFPPPFLSLFLHVQPAENHNHSFHQDRARQRPECGGPCRIRDHQRWRLLPSRAIPINDMDKNVEQECGDEADAERPEMWPNPFQRDSQKGYPQSFFVAAVPLVQMLSMSVVRRKVSSAQPPRSILQCLREMDRPDLLRTSQVRYRLRYFDHPVQRSRRKVQLLGRPLQ